MQSYTTNAELRYRGRRALQNKWGRAILVVLIAGLLSSIATILRNQYLDGLGLRDYQNIMYSLSQYTTSRGNSGMETFLFLLTILQIFINPFLALGCDLFFIQIQQGGDPAPNTVFARSGIFLKAVGLYLLMGIKIFLWTLLLIIPGIVAAYRYAMAPYLMAQHPEIGISEAIDRSSQMMNGHKGRLFTLQLSFWLMIFAAMILTSLLGFLTPFLSSLVLIVLLFMIDLLLYSTTAAFYLDLSSAAHA